MELLHFEPTLVIEPIVGWFEYLRAILCDFSVEAHIPSVEIVLSSVKYHGHDRSRHMVGIYREDFHLLLVEDNIGPFSQRDHLNLLPELRIPGEHDLLGYPRSVNRAMAPRVRDALIMV